MNHHRMHVIRRVLAVGLVGLLIGLFTALRPSGAGAQTQSPGVVAFAFNDLGMHCYDNDFSIFTLLPPFNVMHTFVIQQGAKPAVLTPTEVQLFYQALRDRKGSINTSSALIFQKTNFWVYALPLFGVDLPPDQGLLGATMPGPRNQRKTITQFDPAMNWFTVPGLPVTDLDDANQFNPYGMWRVGVCQTGTSTMIAKTQTVLPVSSEAHCDVCHQTGSDAASPGFHGVDVWSANADPNLRTRENILMLHDALNGTTLMNSRPVRCSSCHYSPPLDLAGTGPTGTQINPATGQPYSWTSHAIHRHHGSVQLNGVPIPDEGINTCYYCHPGPDTKCLRGVMAKAGLVCQSCHGSLMAVANTNRYPWRDMPKCQSCHTGDAVSNLGGQMTRRLAYNDGPDLATPLIAPNPLFAENPDPANPGQFLLFRNSKTHGPVRGPQVPCSACHGSPHAEWPVMDPKSNDNTEPVRLQGHTGPISECTVCHGDGFSPPLSRALGGPHGMHVVGDAKWWDIGPKNHKVLLAQTPTAMAQCQACHGVNLEGTILSRSVTDRVFMTGPMQNNPITVPKGTPVHCAMCHATLPVN